MKLLLITSLVVAFGARFDVLTGDQEVIRSGNVLKEWNPDYSSGSACHPVPQISEGEGSDYRDFIFKNTGNAAFELKYLNVDAKDHSILVPEFISPSDSNIMPEESKTFRLNYYCTGEPGWDVVHITFTISTDIEKDYEIKYMKICNSSNISNFDWSMMILLIIAIIVVGFSAWSAKIVRILPNMPEDANELQTIHAVLFIACGSLFLIVLFLFKSYLENILTAIICAASIGAITFVLDSILESWHWESSWNFPYFGEVKQKLLLFLSISTSIILFYLFTKNWILNNIIGICYTFMVIKSVKISSFKIGAMLLGLAFFYDIFWVFLSEKVFGANVMVTVATGLDLPLKIQCPHIQSLPWKQTCGMIGLGDLALPGLLIAYASRLDLVYQSNYLRTMMICYAIALLMCTFVLAVFHAAQPALLYISPMLIFGMLFQAVMRKELPKVWEGRRPTTNLLHTEVALQDFRS